MDYFWNVLVWVDKGVNVLFAPLLNLLFKPKYKFGDHRDDLSEVFGRNQAECKACRFICKILNYFETEHCKKSIED